MNPFLVYVLTQHYCEDCNNRGWCFVLPEDAHPKRDAPELQRCDACEIYSCDDEAQAAFLRAVVEDGELFPDSLIIHGPL